MGWERYRDKINYRVELSGMREKSANKDDRNLGRWNKSEIWEDGLNPNKVGIMREKFGKKDHK